MPIFRTKGKIVNKKVNYKIALISNADCFSHNTESVVKTVKCDTTSSLAEMGEMFVLT